MGLNIQDRQIPGITGKLVVGFVVTMITLITTFEVGYFKIISKIELIQSERETYQTIIKYTLEAMKQDIYNNREEVKELRKNVEEMRNKVEEMSTTLQEYLNKK